MRQRTCPRAWRAWARCLRCSAPWASSPAPSAGSSGAAPAVRVTLSLLFQLSRSRIRALQALQALNSPDNPPVHLKPPTRLALPSLSSHQIAPFLLWKPFYYCSNSVSGLDLDHSDCDQGPLVTAVLTISISTQTLRCDQNFHLSRGYWGCDNMSTRVHHGNPIIAATVASWKRLWWYWYTIITGLNYTQKPVWPRPFKVRNLLEKYSVSTNCRAWLRETLRSSNNRSHLFSIVTICRTLSWKTFFGKICFYGGGEVYNNNCDILLCMNQGRDASRICYASRIFRLFSRKCFYSNVERNS